MLNLRLGENLIQVSINNLFRIGSIKTESKSGKRSVNGTNKTLKIADKMPRTGRKNILTKSVFKLIIVERL